METLSVRARIDLDADVSFASDYVFRRMLAPKTKVLPTISNVNGITHYSRFHIQWGIDSFAMDDIYLSAARTSDEFKLGNKASAKFILGRRTLRMLRVIK